MQVEFTFAQPKVPTPVARDVEIGGIFKDLESSRILIRVKPTSFLLNSNVIADVLTRADVFVVFPENGTLYAISGNRSVKLLEGKVTITGEIDHE